METVNTTDSLTAGGRLAILAALVKIVTKSPRGRNKTGCGNVKHIEEVNDVSEAAVEERETQVIECRHHWVIETPSGSLSVGRCRRCGAVREFRNSMPDTYWDEESSVGAWGKRSSAAPAGEKAQADEADSEPALAL